MGQDDAVGSSYDDRCTMIPISESEEALDLALTPKSLAIIAERRAAMCRWGPSATPVARSSGLTIPPGISSTALLDSPIMLPNYQVFLFLGFLFLF